MVLALSLGAARGAAATIEVQGAAIVHDETTVFATPPTGPDPNRCVIVWFVEFPDVPGATSVTGIVTRRNSTVEESYSTRPPWPEYSLFVAGVTHVFKSPDGRHRIPLSSYSTGAGCDDALAQTKDSWSLVRVVAEVDEDNAPPTAAFRAAASKDDPFTIEFDASSSTDDKGITDYRWDFGDGGSGSGMRTPHTFDAPGTYPVTLTVTDTDGVTDSFFDDVRVEPCGEPAGGTGSGEADFRVLVRNSAGQGVRNVRFTIVACGAESETTVRSDPTDRTGGVSVRVPYDGDATFVITPDLRDHVLPASVQRDLSEGTTVVDFTTSDTCFQKPITVLGTEQADTLALYSGDVVSALGGRDTITGAAGEAGFTACGGEHGDTIDLSGPRSIGDQVDGGGGDDTIATGAGPDRVLGGEDPDKIVGGADDDELFGGGGDDEIRAGAGCDGLVGDTGNDILDGGGGANTVPLYGGCPAAASTADPGTT